MFTFYLGIITLILTGVFILFFAIKKFIFEDFHPLWLICVIFFLYFFGKGILSLIIGG